MQRCDGREARAGREAGFTLVEIVVTLVITAVVVAGIFEMFNTMHKWSITSGVKAELQQNARIGLETVTRDLEMTGYHTTNYGDPNKANLAITYAAADSIELDQQRLDIDAGTYEPRLVYYHLATDAGTGKRNLYRQIRTEPGLASPDQLVAENVAAFTLRYFDKDNAAVSVAPPLQYVAGVAPPASLKSIRRINVTLTTRAGRADVPIGTLNPEYTLSASVMPQNLENPENTGDVNPPSVPTGLNVVDSRSCANKLLVRWTRNPVSELDLAGYVVFYGATQRRLVPLSGLADRNNPSITLNPGDLLITRDADRTTAPNTYALQIAAYDSSGNYSARSAPAVSANPSTDVSVFGGADDTTVNPAKPSPPASLAVNPAGEYELAITWSPPSDGSATVGYRLYRSTTPFVHGAHIGDALEIADESTLESGDTSFTDTGLEGCRTYYYAVASVNCDDSLVATYVHRTSGASDYAAASGAPQDTTPPPPPSLAGSVAGWQRAFITLKNPTVEECPDLLGSEIYFSRVGEPQLVNGSVVGGALIPDSDHGVPGSFVNRGSQVVVFDSESVPAPPSPTLLNQGSYHILAVTYDRCLNTSSASTALVLIELCGDDPPGAPPSAPTPPLASSCEVDSVALSWTYARKDELPTLYDFAGYRVERTGPMPGFPTVELTTGPTWLESWTDAGPLVAGGVYTYAVRATDCVYENQNSLFPTNRSLPGTSQPIYPGRLQRYAGSDPLALENFVTTASDEARPFTHHNNVRFHLQNTSGSTMTLQKIAVTWENPNVVLDQVVVGGPPSATTERVISAGGAASGQPVTVNARIDDLAGGVGVPSGPVPVRLRFMTPGGDVSALTDMRGEGLEVSLWVQNDSLQPLECALPDRIPIEVPRGPRLGGFSQDTPGIFGVDSHEVIGPSGTARDNDIKVPGGRLVNVFGSAVDNSRDLFADGLNRGFATLKVVALEADLAPSGSTPAMPSGGTYIERPLQSLGGSRYAIFDASTLSGARMPLASDRVLWYYALAVDRTGNWDRVPEPDSGDYAYYQLGPDVCQSANPSAPVLSLTTDTSHAYLSWSAPTTYDDGGTIPPSDPLRYDVSFSHDGLTGWTLIAPGDALGTTLTFTGDMAGQAWYFHVKAKNSCAASPKVSVASNVVRECEGAFGVYCQTFAVTPASAPVGAAVAVDAPDICMLRGNGNPNDTVTIRVASPLEVKTFTVAESAGDGGSFSLSFGTTEGASGPSEVRVLGGQTLSVYLFTADGVLRCTKTVAISGGVCTTTPKDPTPFSAARGASGSGAAIITWGAPTQNVEDNSPLTDLAGYEIETGLCSNWNSSRNRCDFWDPFVPVVINDPAALTHTVTGLTIGSRYRFRMRAFDSCAPAHNYSIYTNTSGIIRVR